MGGLAPWWDGGRWQVGSFKQKAQKADRDTLTLQDANKVTESIDLFYSIRIVSSHATYPSEFEPLSD